MLRFGQRHPGQAHELASRARAGGDPHVASPHLQPLRKKADELVVGAALDCRSGQADSETTVRHSRDRTRLGPGRGPDGQRQAASALAERQTLTT